MNKKIINSIAILSLGIIALSGCHNSSSNLDDSKIIVVHTNDAHCYIDNDLKEDGFSIGYETVAGVHQELVKKYKNVSLVDAGDHIQGGRAGTFSRGEYIIEIMNEMRFTVSTIGNHEFDYGVERFEYLSSVAAYPYVSCNFMDIKKQTTLHSPYHIEEYSTSKGIIKVSDVGITTPEAITKSNPKNFQDEQGNYLYSFCQDESGELLYSIIQNAIDKSRKEGADYVILLGHVGQNGITQRYRSDVITSHITGADAFIDGHSHEEYIQKVKDKAGKEIIIAQVGSYNKAVGVLSIDLKNNMISDEIIHDSDNIDENIKEKVKEIDGKLDEKLSQVIGHTNYRLSAKDDKGNWLVRTNETNLADLVADSFTSALSSDLSLIGGGSVRNDIEIGNITSGNVLDVAPFGNDTVVIKASGQQIKDALEMGAKNYPQNSGAFMQVSRLTYTINSQINSNVVLDENNNFVSVDGEYRVRDIKINNIDIDLDKIYSISGSEYTLCNGGDGLTMFKGCEKVVVGPKDVDLLLSYIRDALNGEIPDTYQNTFGQGRINII